jgi:enoyl-CoA hydratase/carnithine racemase
MTDGDVRYRRDGEVATVIFDRPAARNAMTWRMYEQLDEACARIRGEHGLRVAVFRGAGGKAFVAGTDIAQFQAFRGADDGFAYEAKIERYIGGLESLPVPTLAVIEGFAIGGGLAIATACDLRVATPGSRLGIPIARTLGNCLSIANIARAVDIIGPAALKDLMLTGRLLDAQESLALGLVTRIVPDDNLADEVRKTAHDLAERAPLTIEVTKAMLARLRDHRRPPPAVDLVERCYGSADFREGVAAFLERRPPRWSGA